MRAQDLSGHCKAALRERGDTKSIPLDRGVTERMQAEVQIREPLARELHDSGVRRLLLDAVSKMVQDRQAPQIVTF